MIMDAVGKRMQSVANKVEACQEKSLIHCAFEHLEDISQNLKSV